MSTITIRLDQETDDKLKRQLARSGETLSEFVREAVTKHLESKPPIERRSASLARVLDKIGDTGETDLSTTYKARRREMLRAKHRR
jgi:Arc/MetJ-type ribon-helix-helix transcriptional regulator